MSNTIKKITAGTSALVFGIALAGAQTTPSSHCIYYTTYNVCHPAGTVLSGGGAPIPPCNVASSVVTDGPAYAPAVTTGTRGGSIGSAPATITNAVPVTITVATPFYTYPSGYGCHVRISSGVAIIYCSGTEADGFCPADDSSGG
jgi:hypothetical protein